MINLEKPFKVFSNCVLIRGHSRAIICDLQRNNYEIIPLSLMDILCMFDGNSINIVLDYFKNDASQIIKEYFSFLIQKEVIFFTDTPNLFPPLSVDFSENIAITNCIIEIDDLNSIDWIKLVNELEVIGCKQIQFRSYKERHSIHSLDHILSYFVYSRVSYIELILKYVPEINYNDYTELLEKHSRIFTIICHTSNEIYSKTDFGNIHFTTDTLTSEMMCGIVNHFYFNSNIKLYTESLHHNTCLNRKISIDAEGNIKNCPSMKESFGNIKDTTLLEAIEKPGFKKYWNIKKDDITVCKVCEFRHICTDCRAYLENPEDIYSKPLKCGYNPYTCEWEEWSTNPLKQKAIEYYGMQELVKNNNYKQ